jgi:hypothetical protein
MEDDFIYPYSILSPSNPLKKGWALIYAKSPLNLAYGRFLQNLDIKSFALQYLSSENSSGNFNLLFKISV